MTCDGVVEIDEQGWGTFTCFANEVQVWIMLPEGAAASSGETVRDFNLFSSLVADLNGIVSQTMHEGRR